MMGPLSAPIAFGIVFSILMILAGVLAWIQRRSGEPSGTDQELSPTETQWWLEWSAPERFIWARLQLFSDGSAVVLDSDGQRHRFPSAREAGLWLNEDEYSRLEDMKAEGEVDCNLQAPSAPTDDALIPLMWSERP